MNTLAYQARAAYTAKSKRHVYGACKTLCSGGRKCECDSRPHHIHTCNDPACECHQAMRQPETPTPLPAPVVRESIVPVVPAHLNLFALVDSVKGRTWRWGRVQP